MKEFDVTIIGAGLAGLQCARLLARQGLRVLLADRRPTLDKKIHTTGIFVRRTLQDFDIPEDCLGPAIRDVSLYSPAHRVLHLQSRYDEFRIGRMDRLYLRYLTQCMLSGVEWLPAANYVDSRQQNNKSLVRLRINSSETTVATRFIIGGDGTRSRVAEDLNLDRNREWIVGLEDVYEDVTLAGSPRLLCFLNSDLAPGYIAWIAFDGEQAHVGVGGYQEQFEPIDSLERFQQSVRTIVDLRKARRMERRGGRIPVGGVLKNIANRRGLLIGDAAGAVSPLTAGGLDPCMRLSALAASVTAEYLLDKNPAALDRYSGQLFRSKFTSRRWARQVAAQMFPNTMIETVCALLRLPGVRQLAAEIFFGHGSFPNVKLREVAEVQLS